jgi:NAD(P)-dependent dehydrogenase (short-subunit alcohol dehydrogenase family)
MTERTVLITGASGGIGRACVEHFLDQGWTVLAVDIDPPQPNLPKGATFLQADLSVPGEIDALCDQLSQQHSRLDALVNNAALQITSSLLETSVEDWDAVQAVNLRAPFLLARGLYPLLKSAGGAVVNVASVHAEATSAEIGAYAASKGGLQALTRTMAIEFAADGVRANAVLPGATDTEMLEAGLSRSSIEDQDPAARKRDLAAKVLLGRLGRPAEIARAIYFLADGEQSSYITGEALAVDGGALAKLSIE